MSKNIPILSIVIGIIIFLRCIFNDSDKIIYIVAGINIVAIIFVLYTIIDRILYNIINRIRDSRVPDEIVEREIKNTQLILWGWSIGVGVVLLVLYIGCWCSGLGNDIISILALGLSILDDEIVEKVASNYKI